MGILVVKINDELEREFRKYAFLVFGQRKGSLSRAVEEAIRMWLTKVREKRRIGFEELEVKVPNNKRDVVKEILSEVNDVEKKKIRSLLKALGVYDENLL